MWAVSEVATPESIEEFCDRYPAHRAELMRRVNMVQGLRNQVKIPVNRRVEPPRFVPREPVQAPNPRGLFLACTLGIAAVAAASYTAYSALHPASHAVGPVPVVRKVDLGPLPQPPIQMKTPPTPTPLPVVERVPPSQQAVPAYLKKQDRIDVKDAKLVDAIMMISAGAGMKVEVGPDFVDQPVSIEYHDVSPLEALQAMAKEYAFSIFDEGDDKFLVLPAADKGGPTATRQPLRRIGP
jgi:hypothetical protein